MTILGRKARNHPQQVWRNGVDDSIDDRRTPGAVFGPLNERHGFTLDVAANVENAKCAKYFTRETDGLAQSWAGERVWCNPPYSAIEPWVLKAWREMRDRCECVVMLLPANRTEQGWWQAHVEPHRDAARGVVRLGTRFLPGRIRFGRPGWEKPLKGDRPPFGLVVLTWTKDSPTPEEARA